MDLGNNQSYLFLLYIINGIVIGVLFDVFRVLRKTFKTSDFITYIEDAIFWILTGIVTLFFIFTFNYGEIRFYIFLGIFIGIIAYMLWLSKYFIKINVAIICFLKNIIVTLINILLAPIILVIKFLKKIFLRPISFLFINIRSFFTKKAKKVINYVKNVKKMSKKKVVKKDF